VHTHVHKSTQAHNCAHTHVHKHTEFMFCAKLGGPSVCETYMAALRPTASLSSQLLPSTPAKQAGRRLEGGWGKVGFKTMRPPADNCHQSPGPGVRGLGHIILSSLRLEASTSMLRNEAAKAFCDCPPPPASPERMLGPEWRGFSKLTKQDRHRHHMASQSP
jgi:hypothetical protein